MNSPNTETQSLRNDLETVITALQSQWSLSLPTNQPLMDFLNRATRSIDFDVARVSRIALKGDVTPEQRACLHREAGRELTATFKFDSTRLKEILDTLVTLWEPFLRHYRANSEVVKDAEALLKELAEMLEMPWEGGVRQILKPLFEAETFALLEKKAANDYWWLRILTASGFPASNWQYRDINVHIGLYKLRQEMHLPFGLPSRHAPFADGTDFVLPAIKGAMLLEDNDVPPAKFVENPIYHDDSPREFMPTAAVESMDIRRNNIPPQPWMTYDEARAFAHLWCVQCDPMPIGAQVYHIPSGKVTSQLYEPDYRKVRWFVG